MHAGRDCILAIALFVAAALGDAAPAARAAPYDGRLAIAAKDEQTGEPLAVRMELRDARGRPAPVRPDGAVTAGTDIYIDGETTLELRRGDYTFLIEAGPEYRTRPGRFTIERNSEDKKEVTLRRIVDMQREGWWAGDLDVEAPLADLPLMMRARGVDIGARRGGGEPARALSQGQADVGGRRRRRRRGIAVRSVGGH